MNKKQSTQKLIMDLKMKSKTDKQKIWKSIAKRLETPRRVPTVVNLDKLEKMSKRFGKKIFVVPGKVLGKGMLTTPTEVIAFNFSASAKRKIIEAGGSAKPLSEILTKKFEGKDLVIVK
ncbi:MAG: 50S ribosomal protein L18e [Candidatus Diapherotrites archaeon]